MTNDSLKMLRLNVKIYVYNFSDQAREQEHCFTHATCNSKYNIFSLLSNEYTPEGCEERQHDDVQETNLIFTIEGSRKIAIH